MRKIGCVDCHRPYGDENGFPDLIIPFEAWKAISPTHDDGGLLCPSCICKRLYDAGITCEGAFMSGPIESVPRPVMYALRRIENVELELGGRKNGVSMKINTTPHPELKELLRKAKYHIMSPREIWLQRVSWAYGQMMDCAPDVTREHVEAASAKMFGPCPTEEPTDEDYDDMLHALGRPSDILKESYRNHYCVEADSDTARRFEALGCWQRVGTINNGRDVIYQVNALGRRVLSEWVRRRHAAK